jgi:hypothetical protein
MRVWIEKLTIQQLIGRRLTRREGYTGLIDKAASTGEAVYRV